MQKYKLIVAYDGARYSGWQIQPNACSIQETLQNALHTLLQQKISVIASGRTDAGVHARGQVAHFCTDQEIDLFRFHRSLNGILPDEIRILEIVPTSPSFHARYSAIGKIYHYHLHLDPVDIPFNRQYHWHVRSPLDIALLKQAAQHFVGTHDFTSFANEAHKGSAAEGAVRIIKRLDVIPQEGGIRLEFEANGFLYKMVRNIVGMLIDVASGKREIGEIVEVLEARDRRLASRAATPKGLFLMEVHYENSALEN